MKEGPVRADQVRGISYRPIDQAVQTDRQFPPAGMSGEEFRKKLQEENPGRGISINSDGSLSVIPRGTARRDPQPRRGKTYAKYNPLWDDPSTLQQY